MSATTAARVTEGAADSAAAKATSVVVGAPTGYSVYHAVGKWTVTLTKMALVAYACHMLVPTFSGFLTLIAALLLVKHRRSILDFARAGIHWLFKPRTGHAHLRARGTRADQHGARKMYMDDIARMPARKVRDPHPRLRH